MSGASVGFSEKTEFANFKLRTMRLPIEVMKKISTVLQK